MNGGMGMADDANYYERRMQQERQAAADADSEHTRRVHEELAALYAKMLNGLRTAANDPA